MPDEGGPAKRIQLVELGYVMKAPLLGGEKIVLDDRKHQPRHR
jgi:hypothetical protein